jgi:hypothetical protein
MKTKLFIIASLLMISVGNAQEYKLYDNFIYNKKGYELHLKNDTENKNYQVKIVKSDVTKESLLFIYEYNEDQFVTNLSEMMTEIDSTFNIDKEPEVKAKWISIHRKITMEVNQKEVLTELYDNQPIEYSGEIRLKDTVTLFLKGENKFKRKLNDTSAQAIKKDTAAVASKGKNEKAAKKDLTADNEKETSTKAEKKDSIAVVPKKETKTLTFIPNYASIRFYNNRINTIAVVGKIDGKEITIRNNKFSVPFRFLNNNKKGSYLNVYVKDSIYELNFDDLLDYNPVGTEFNFSVKNKNYKIKAKEEVKIESRNLFDYFTAIVFSDFLGVSNSSSNSLLMAEGRAVIPLALVNRDQSNLINYFEGYLTTSLYNGEEDGTNFVTWKSDLANGGMPDKVVLFDFFKKRNIETGLNFGIYTFEWKGISTNVILDYGVQFYRTKLRYIVDDQNTYEDYQAYCIGHGPKIKFEIRPQVNFGADLNIGFIGFNFNGMSGSNELRKELKSVMEDKATFLNGFYIVSNFYTKLNDKESNSGLYFRLGSYYDFNTSDIAPQVMVGYATNLTSFINKFKKKDEVPVTSTP